MNREEFCQFVNSAPARQEDSENVRLRLIAALKDLPPHLITMKALARESGVNYTTIWHRIKHSWKLKPTGHLVGPSGHKLGTYDPDQILAHLQRP
jgi:hypothetical protein